MGHSYTFTRAWASLTAGIGVEAHSQVMRLLLRIAVDSLHVQSAMLERLDELAAQRPAERPTSGRFSSLAGD